MVVRPAGPRNRGFPWSAAGAGRRRSEAPLPSWCRTCPLPCRQLGHHVSPCPCQRGKIVQRGKIGSDCSHQVHLDLRSGGQFRCWTRVPCPPPRPASTHSANQAETCDQLNLLLSFPLSCEQDMACACSMVKAIPGCRYGPYAQGRSEGVGVVSLESIVWRRVAFSAPGRRAHHRRTFRMSLSRSYQAPKTFSGTSLIRRHPIQDPTGCQFPGPYGGPGGGGGGSS